MADLEPTQAGRHRVRLACGCAYAPMRRAFPPAIARGLEAHDPDQMRAAANFLIERGQTEGLRRARRALPQQEGFRRLGAGDEFTAASAQRRICRRPRRRRRSDGALPRARRRALVGCEEPLPGRPRPERGGRGDHSRGLGALSRPLRCPASCSPIFCRAECDTADSLAVWRDLIARFAGARARLVRGSGQCPEDARTKRGSR